MWGVVVDVVGGWGSARVSVGGCVWGWGVGGLGWRFGVWPALLRGCGVGGWGLDAAPAEGAILCRSGVQAAKASVLLADIPDHF